MGGPSTEYALGAMARRMGLPLCLALLALPARAEETSPVNAHSSIHPQQSTSDEFDYPELLVTPSASERLKMEAKSEKSAGLSRMLPIEISGALTLLAGATSLNDPGPSSNRTGGVR